MWQESREVDYLGTGSWFHCRSQHKGRTPSPAEGVGVLCWGMSLVLLRSLLSKVRHGPVAKAEYGLRMENPQATQNLEGDLNELLAGSPWDKALGLSKNGSFCS